MSWSNSAGFLSAFVFILAVLFIIYSFSPAAFPDSNVLVGLVSAFFGIVMRKSVGIC